jgi:osmotically-inducible protein OsmY
LTVPRHEDEARERLVAKVREALAEDPRLGEVEVAVRADGDRIVITGTVATPARREAISRVVADLLPGATVDNRTSVPPLAEPEEAERIS